MTQESKKTQERALREDPVTEEQRVILKMLRPRYRGECSNGQRPCPWYSCQFHLGLDVAEDGRIIIHTAPDALSVDRESCALDVADKGEHTLDFVGDLIGWSRERARQIETDAVRKLRHPSRANIVRSAIESKPHSKGNPWDETDPIGQD